MTKKEKVTEEMTAEKRKVQKQKGANDGKAAIEKPTGSPGLNNKHYRDSSGKLIFKDPILCSQFLRDYVDIPLLKDVQPEDIEDVTDRFIHMFVEERDSDVVKKVNLKNNPFYLISLIEHKSDVDYNVIMQVFRYITFIWEDYEKEMERTKAGISRTKDFRYPPVLPIVFYDGTDNWTAATSLHERVLFSDILGKYIPDYHCMLKQLKDYSNAELMEKNDELSILMLIDKLKTSTDYKKLQTDLNETFLKEATNKTPEYLLKLMAQIIEIFLIKLNIPQEEAELFTVQIKERQMGELFKHFEGWDVQELRREIADAKEEAERQKKEAEKQREEVEKQREEAEKQREEAEKQREEAEKQKKETEKQKENGIQKLVKVIKEFSGSQEKAQQKLMEEYNLSRESAVEKVALYW